MSFRFDRAAEQVRLGVRGIVQGTKGRGGFGALMGALAVVAVALGLVGVVAGEGEAQAGQQYAANNLAPVRGEIVFYGDLALPVGEFRDNVDLGGGGGLAGVWLLDGHGMLGLRLDGAFVLYGYRSERRPFSLTVPEVAVDVRTTNYIVSGGVGPQVYLATGPVRPYVYGTVGVAYFATESTVSGEGWDDDDIASSTNLHDTSLALSGGGGLSIRVANRANPVSLDLGASYQYNGETEYLTSGLPVPSAVGGRRFLPLLSETNMVVFRVGVTLGMR